MDKLGRFDHHPDPAIDFCIEVEELEGMAYNVSVGLDERQSVARRINRAMEFVVGGDPGAVVAKGLLRELERQVGRPT